MLIEFFCINWTDIILVAPYTSIDQFEKNVWLWHERNVYEGKAYIIATSSIKWYETISCRLIILNQYYKILSQHENEASNKILIQKLRNGKFIILRAPAFCRRAIVIIRCFFFFFGVECNKPQWAWNNIRMQRAPFMLIWHGNYAIVYTCFWNEKFSRKIKIFLISISTNAYTHKHYNIQINFTLRI